MSEGTASLIVSLAGVYFGLGLLFALGFVTLGASRIDPVTRGMPLQARLILLPGSALLWPVLLWRTLTRQQPPVT
jgi:hypothetical protein